MVVEIRFEMEQASDYVVWRTANDAVLAVEGYGPPEVTVIEPDGTRRPIGGSPLVPQISSHLRDDERFEEDGS